MTSEEFYIEKYIREIVHPDEDPERFKRGVLYDLIFFPFFGILPAIGPILTVKNLITKIDFWSCVVIFSFLTLFAIYICINPYKKQKEIVLYIGMFYLLFSICLITNAIVYTGVLAHLYILSFLLFAIYIALLWYVFKILIPRMLKGFRWEKSKFYKSKLGRKITGIAVSISSVAGVLGMYIAKVTANFLSHRGVYTVLALCLAGLSYLFVFGGKFLYKYYLIIKYPQFYRYIEPPKKKQKRASKKKRSKVEKTKSSQSSEKA